MSFLWFAAMAAIAGASLWNLPKVWRGSGFDNVPAFWPYSDALWRGYLRSQALIGASLCALALAYFFAVVDPGPLRSGLHAFAVWIPCGVVAVTWFVLVPGVIVFNWPKAVVPPPRRDQPGALAEWRDRH